LSTRSLKSPRRARGREPSGPYIHDRRQHNERLNTLTNPKRQTETSGTHADILPDLRVIQYTYPLIEASRTIHHVTSLDDRRRYARVQSFPNTAPSQPFSSLTAVELAHSHRSLTAVQIPHSGCPSQPSMAVCTFFLQPMGWSDLSGILCLYNVGIIIMGRLSQHGVN
jgi:hypothetical protein